MVFENEQRPAQRRGLIDNPNYDEGNVRVSVAATDWVKGHSRSRGSARLVLHVIASYCGPNGQGAWPSVVTIARESNLSMRTVARALVDLEGSGELVVQRNAGKPGRGGWTNLYELPKVCQALPSRSPVEAEALPTVARDVVTTTTTKGFTDLRDSREDVEQGRLPLLTSLPGGNARQAKSVLEGLRRAR